MLTTLLGTSHGAEAAGAPAGSPAAACAPPARTTVSAAAPRRLKRLRFAIMAPSNHGSCRSRRRHLALPACRGRKDTKIAEMICVSPEKGERLGGRAARG